MKKLLLVAVIAVVLVIVASYMMKSNPGIQLQSGMLASSATPQASPTGESIILINEKGYEPKTITVKVGTKVVWQNKSGSTANVSSDKHPTHLIYPPLNLGSIGNGGETSLVFDKPGTFGYHNHLNASQTGTVIVQ